jgi:CheY-like chemotaxis protein
MEPALHEEKHILVVDDNPADLNFLKKILRGEGYTVHTTVDAEQALEFVQSSRSYRPDIILFDVNMPGMGGYEVCEKLKADEHACDAPIIFISAFSIK